MFWYINKLVPSCTEGTILLNMYPVFVSKFDFDFESNIRQHSTVDRRTCYNAIQNVFVVWFKFLITYSTKKAEGQTSLVFVLLYDLACTFLLEKLYLEAKSACVYTIYDRKISLRLIQLNLVSLSTKGNYKEGKEMSLAIVLLCKLSCG